MEENIKKVLKMIEDGKLTAEEGSRLILAMREGAAKQDKKPGKYFRVLIEDGEDRVNVKLPLFLVKWLGKISPWESTHFELNGKNVDISYAELMKAIDAAEGELVDIHSEDGAIVKVWIE